MLCIVSMYIQVFVRISSDYRLIRIQKRKLFKPQIKLRKIFTSGRSDFFPKSGREKIKKGQKIYKLL